MDKEEKIMVTVICITYNQQEYIKQALSSFVKQKTNFLFKVFVGDDCSTDNTPNIIKEFADKYPDIIIPFIREQNMGAQRNLIDLCNKAKSPYIAFCEGDDYWIDNYKLQKQFDFMEENKNCNVCFHNARIDIETKDGSWFQSKAYEDYESDLLIYPRGLKNFKKDQTFFKLAEFIKVGFIQTSSIFYRWNYNAIIPEWYYNHILGDYTLTAIQVGTADIGYIDDIMSVYRKHQSGVYFFKSNDEYMIKTRKDWVEILKDLKDYFIKYYDGYAINDINKRLHRETFNYIKILLKYDQYEDLINFTTKNPELISDVMKYIINEQQKFNLIKKRLTTKSVNKILNSKKIAIKVKKNTNSIIKKQTKTERIKTFLRYWIYAFIPKRKNLWVFTSFRKKGYLDNTKYLYEFLNTYHPEIKAIWLTKDKKVIDYLTDNNLPVCKMHSKQGRKIMSRAKLVFTDHFIMSDYKSSAINARTKVVQLWHGVGLKDLDNFNQTDVEGVKLSDDIIASKGDSIITKIKKSFRYIKYAPFRELCEKYFLLLGPGKEPITTLAKTNKVKENNWFVCGYPRNVNLYKKTPADSYKILYAPTYRWDSGRELNLIESFIKFVPELSNFLEVNNAEFVIRLHPHTWRNYENKIIAAINKFPRISIDDNKDIYENLNTYSLIISDYSSIVYDFLILDKPMVFYCPDYDYYLSEEGTFKYPFEDYTPGPKTNSWEDTIKEIKSYMEKPEKDSEFRHKVYEFFYTDDVNDENNSERIIQELKRRLKMK